jgi:RHS repeat-associated protein
MDVVMSHYVSRTNFDTYLYLLDASGKNITDNNNPTYNEKPVPNKELLPILDEELLLDEELSVLSCEDDFLDSGVYPSGNELYPSLYSHAHLSRTLEAGTYYVVSEGYDRNGVILTNISGTVKYKQGDVMQEPIIAGTFSSDFQYSNSHNTTNFTDTYTGRPTNDVFYKFTLTRKMNVVMTHCGSQINFDTYLHLLDASGKSIAFNDDPWSKKFGGSTVFEEDDDNTLYEYKDDPSYIEENLLAIDDPSVGNNLPSKDGECPSFYRHSYLSKVLEAGTYYVVSEGYSENGVILTNISGTVIYPQGNTKQNPISVGTFSSDFQYSNSQNTAEFTNAYTGRSTNDVFYKFTLARKMDVIMSHCGSQTGFDTYLHLLDASGKSITFNNDPSEDEVCTSSFSHSYLSKTLEEGTYYVVSEGYSGSGVILTNISGTIIPNEFDYPYFEAPSTSSAESEPVGSVAGMFDVSATGAATYAIPIAAPPGVGGIQPSIAIVYNSQGGNGLAGWGCNVSGISAITRTPKSVHFDAIAKGLTHSTDDAYLLDGQRLILYIGTEGENGAVYYPESDPFTKVTVHGTGLNTWFEVLDKNGTKYYYGNSSSAQQRYSAGSVKINAWYIDYVEDVLGNYMNYIYTNSDYFYMPSLIRYGKNKNKTSTFENTINFEYESRPDVMPFMLETVKASVSRRLSKITSKTGNATFREYVLGYTNSDHFSRLTSITEKNEAGEALKPTILNWSYIPSVNYSSRIPSVTGGLNNLDVQYYTSGDLNRDGVSDIISFTPNYTYTYMNWNTIVTLSQHYLSRRQSDGSYKYEASDPRYLPTAVDINKVAVQRTGSQAVFNAFGDGYQYILVPVYTSGIHFNDGSYGKALSLYAYRPNDSGPIDVMSSTNAPPLKCEEVPKYVTGDIYNTGQDLIVFVEKSHTNGYYDGKIIKLKSFSNNRPVYRWIDFNPKLAGAPEEIFLSDFNGDGMNDLFIFYNGGYTIYWNGGRSYFPYSQPFSENNKVTGTNIGNVKMIRMGDFNGDGLPDFIMNATNENKWYFALNNGNGTFTKQLACTLDIYDQSFTDYDDDVFNCHVFDFDYDGKSDIVINKAMYDKSISLPKFRKTHTYWLRSTGTSLMEVSSATSDVSVDVLDRLYTLGDFNGDGKTDLLGYGYDCYTGASARTMRLYTNSGVTPVTGMITSFTDGYDRSTYIGYDLLTSDIYSIGFGGDYPVMDCALPIAAVKSVKSDNGAAGTLSLNYKYAKVQIHLTGKGFLGMNQTVTNEANGITTESGIKTLNFSYFTPVETYTKTTIAKATKTTYVKYNIKSELGELYFKYPKKKTEKDLDGNTVTTTYEYDFKYGNVTEEKIEWDNNMYRTVTYSDYIQAGGTMPNKPQLITEVSKHADDGETFTRKTKITYNTTTGYPTKKIENYGSSLPLTTEYTNYDEFGNLKSYKVSGEGLNTITYNTDYDSTNRFVAKTYSSPEYTVTSFTYDVFGNVLTEKDETNSSEILTTTHAYDNWGRKTSTITPDNNKIVYSTGWGMKSANKRYYTLAQAKGQPWVKTYYDETGRETAVETIGPKGISIKAVNTYDTKGLLSKTETTQGSLSFNKTFTYDERNRLTNESGSNGQSTAYAYGNRKITTTINGKDYIKTYDAWGGIKQIDDPETNVTYTYHSSGKPSKVSAAGVDFSFTYDNAGNQKTLTDPNAGTITYTYNAAAQAKMQIDGKGKKTEHFLDNLNRNSYSTIDGVRTDYTYGDSGYDLHLLTKVNTGNNTVNYTYEKYGRMKTEKRQIDGSEQLEFEYKYNSLGQLETLVYPENVQVKQEYDAYGNLIKVLAETQAIWELTGNTGLTTTIVLGGTMTATSSYNSQGLLTNQKTVKDATVVRDMSYIFNSFTGNLDSRTGMLNQTETFFYDDLDRLNSVKHAGTEVMKINYKPNGNISYKTGLGAYSYHDVKKHAITEVDNTDNLISAEGQNIAYTAFNKAYNINEIVNDDAYELYITYGPDQQRWKSDLRKNDAVVRTTIYAGDYEKISENGVVTQQLYYISGADGLAAIYVKQPNQTDNIYYVHRDHLGSILSLTDANGTAAFNASYDAWGKQTITNNTFKFHRGFTGHEHLPEFALINMNGRMYDPILGRFLSPDPYVQAPDMLQNFNRYSYCLNNPLIYTDPSGENPIIVAMIIGAVIGAYSGGVMANDGQFNPVKWDYNSGKTWGYMLGGAVVGGASGALGAYVATSGRPMANTMGIAGASFMNSVGMAAVTGQTPISISFGVVSYDFTNNSFGYLGKKGNKWYENLGYGLGALANVSDILAGFKPGEVQLQTENTSTAEAADKIGHSQILDADGNSLIDFGPGKGGEFYQFKQGRNNWINYASDGAITQTKDIPGNLYTQGISIKGVNVSRITSISNNLNKNPGFYNFALRSCSSVAARALTISGAPMFGIHPYLLQLQATLWNAGIRPWTFSYFLNQQY